MAEIITVTALNRYVKNLLERDAVLDGLATAEKYRDSSITTKAGTIIFRCVMNNVQ